MGESRQGQEKRDTHERARDGENAAQQPSDTAYQRRKRITVLCFTHGLWQPNGSRLSCERNPRRRKESERLIKRLAGEAT